MATHPLRANCAQVTYTTVSRVCRAHDIAPSAFGRRALGDPGLVYTLREGRRLRPATAARVLQFIASLEA